MDYKKSSRNGAAIGRGTYIRVGLLTKIIIRRQKDEFIRRNFLANNARTPILDARIISDIC